MKQRAKRVEVKVNLADRKAAQELLRKLYGNNEETQENTSSEKKNRRTAGVDRTTQSS